MMSDRPPRKWRRRALVALAVLIGLFAAAVIGVRLYLSPDRAAGIVRDELARAVAAPVQVRSASVGLVSGSTLEGVEVGDYLTIERITADVSVAGAARGQRPIEVAYPGRIVRFGVAEQEQGLHAPTSSIMTSAGASLAFTRTIASSSGSRMTCTPGGKAESRREGVAAESRTKTPRSSWRRISRPNAWASRPRTSRSS